MLFFALERKRDDPLNIEDEEDLFYQDLRKSNKRINQGNGIYAIRNSDRNIFSNMKDSNYNNQILLSKNKKINSNPKNELGKFENKRTKKMKCDEYKKIYSNSDETNDEEDNIFMFETPPIKKKANLLKGSLMEKQIKNLKKALKNYMNKNVENNKLTIVLDLNQPEKIEINGETLEKNISCIKQIVHSVQKPEENIAFNERNANSQTKTSVNRNNYDIENENGIIAEDQSKIVPSSTLVEKVSKKINQDELNNEIPPQTNEIKEDFNATNFEKLSSENDNNTVFKPKTDIPEITNTNEINSNTKNIVQPEQTNNTNENNFNPFLTQTASMQQFNLNSFISSNMNNVGSLPAFKPENNNLYEQNTFTNMNANNPIVQEQGTNLWKNEPAVANNFFFNQQQEYPCNNYNMNSNYFTSNNEMIFENNNPKISEPDSNFRSVPLMNNNSMSNINNNNNNTNGINNLCNFLDNNYANTNNPFSIINDGRYDINEQIKTNFVTEHKDAGNLFSVKNQNNSAQTKLSSYMNKKGKTQKLRINDL